MDVLNYIDLKEPVHTFVYESPDGKQFSDPFDCILHVNSLEFDLWRDKKTKELMGYKSLQIFPFGIF